MWVRASSVTHPSSPGAEAPTAGTRRIECPPSPTVSRGFRARLKAGIASHMDVVTTIADVRTFETRGGNQRYVVRDADDNEYTTFREAIGEQARGLQGRRVRLEYHEEQRGQYTNVYLDKVEPAAEEHADTPDTDAEEAAWRTAVDAAPWLV